MIGVATSSVVVAVVSGRGVVVNSGSSSVKLKSKYFFMISIKPVVGIIVVVAGAVLVVVSGVSAGRMRIFMRRDVS